MLGPEARAAIAGQNRSQHTRRVRSASPTPPPSSDAAPRHAPAPQAELWVELLGWVALAVFIALPIFTYVFEEHAGGVVWTLGVASLPVFIVLVGYHRWRRICPLAFLAQLPARLKRPGTRKAGAWLETNYHYLAFSAFFVSLWLRLIATNGDGHAISAFVRLLSLMALLFGVLYTGKTWCNYVCPLSFIEKIYTEPHGLRETPNSQCIPCTACKKACPDINEENGCCKEIGARPKRLVYYAFPGLVFGFYCYFYPQAGTWHYHLGGAWTRQPGLVYTAFVPGEEPWTAGFFLLPAVPRALAAAAATLLLVRRLPRTPQAFAEETLARNIVKHWEWTDVEPPQDWREAFLIHTVRTRESQRSSASILEGYKNAVHIALADGFVTREEVQQLAALRHQLDITRADHERIMSELAEEKHDVRANPAGQVLAASGGNAHRMAAHSTAAANGASSPMEHRTMASSDHGTPGLP